MKQSGATIVFVIVCAAVLAAAFAAGICIREIRFSAARNEFTTATVAEKPNPEPGRSRQQARRMPGPEGMDARRGLSPEGGSREQASRMPGPGGMVARDGFSPEGRGGGLGDQRAGMRERLENMSDEEREQFMAQMRERFGGRRRENMPQLSEEQRAEMRKEMEELRARSEEMSDQEREEARAKIFEKYGLPTRGFGGRSGGSRSFGGGESGRRRPSTRPDEGQ